MGNAAKAATTKSERAERTTREDYSAATTRWSAARPFRPLPPHLTSWEQMKHLRRVPAG
jgi:hypothetical protein